MKIYIDSNYRIKAIDKTDDLSLTEIEVDRKLIFGDMSDFMILNYCYKQDENGYSIYPARNYSDIVEEDYRLKVDESQKKISILEAENESLKEGLRAVLRGDMQSLAYILYPEDFNTFRK